MDAAARICANDHCDRPIAAGALTHFCGRCRSRRRIRMMVNVEAWRFCLSHKSYVPGNRFLANRRVCVRCAQILQREMATRDALGMRVLARIARSRGVVGEASRNARRRADPDLPVPPNANGLPAAVVGPVAPGPAPNGHPPPHALPVNGPVAPGPAPNGSPPPNGPPQAPN